MRNNQPLRGGAKGQRGVSAAASGAARRGACDSGWQAGLKRALALWWATIEALMWRGLEMMYGTPRLKATAAPWDDRRGSALRRRLRRGFPPAGVA